MTEVLKPIIRLENEWTAFQTFLIIDRKQAEGHNGKNMLTVKSRYLKLARWFDTNELEFGRINFNLFIADLKSQNFKNTYLNVFIKLAKQLAIYKGIKADFEDYTYFREFREKDIKPLSPEDITALAEVILPYIRRKDLINQRMRALVYFLGVVGSRLTETLLLTRNDIYENPLPYIRFREENTKGNKSRDCVIPKWLLDILLALPEDKTLFGISDNAWVNLDLKRRSEASGIKSDIWAHLFRYSSINTKLEGGMSIQDVAKYHGHTNIETTFKKYFVVSLQQMANTLAIYDPMFRGNQTLAIILKLLRDFLDKIVDKRQFTVTTEENENEILIRVKKFPKNEGDKGS